MTLQRRAIWRHNSFFGFAAMMRSQCQSIIDAPTTTYEAKKAAQRIFNLSLDLTEALKTRHERSPKRANTNP